MNKTLKRIMSLVLVAVILCCPFVNVAQSAHAVGGAAGELLVEFAPEILPLLLAALAAAGITFGTKGEAVQAAAQFYRDNPIIHDVTTALKNACVFNPQIGLNSLKLRLDAALYLQFLKLIKSVKQYFSRSESTVTFQKSVPNYTKYQNAILTDTSSVKGANSYSIAYSLANYKATDSVTITGTDGKTYTWKIVDNGTTAKLYLNNVNSGTYYTCDHSGYANFNLKWALLPKLYNNKMYLVPYIAWTYMSGTQTAYLYNGVLGTLSIEAAHVPFIAPIDASKIVDLTTGVPVGYDFGYDCAESDFDNAAQLAQDKLATSGTTLDISLEGEYGDVQEGTDEETADTNYVARWAAILTALGIYDLVKTLKQSAAASEKDIDTPKMPVDIKDKFPFCVPFDLIALVTALNAPAVVPSATIPIKFSALHYESSMTIELSQFEGVAKAVRWGMTILFLFGLTVLTRKLIKG